MKSFLSTRRGATNPQPEFRKLNALIRVLLGINFVGLSICVGTALEQEKEVEIWKGLVVADELTLDDCPPYQELRDDYQYSPNADLLIAQQLGGFYSPYDDVWYELTTEVDVDHIVARKEAHDSGMCLATPEERYEFANDLLNLTLATPSVNRDEKRDKDPGEWLPEYHQCWYVFRVISVKKKYKLTVDERERNAIQDVLDDCTANDLFLEPLRVEDDSIEEMSQD